MSLRLIAEIASTHMGKFPRIIEAIDRCKAAGIDALKLQLFPNEAPYTYTEIPDTEHPSLLIKKPTGNIWLSPEMFREAFVYGKSIGLPVTASVFDLTGLDFLTSLKPDFIKFSYSQKEWASFLINRTDRTDSMDFMVSCDVMTDHLINGAFKLYCIPEYPVRYEISFDELFPRFDGFSDHTMGIRQTTRAINAGAQIIEKHVRLGYDDETCPDARFAVTIETFANVRTF